MYDQPITGRRTRQRNEFQALATIDEARDPPVESTSSDSHLAYESSPEGEDSESGMVLLTPPLPEEPRPREYSPGQPCPPSQPEPALCVLWWAQAWRLEGQNTCCLSSCAQLAPKGT